MTWSGTTSSAEISTEQGRESTYFQYMPKSPASWLRTSLLSPQSYGGCQEELAQNLSIAESYLPFSWCCNLRLSPRFQSLHPKSWEQSSWQCLNNKSFEVIISFAISKNLILIASLQIKWKSCVLTPTLFPLNKLQIKNNRTDIDKLAAF